MKFLSSVILTLCFAAALYAQKQAEVIVTSTYLRGTPNFSGEKLKTLQKGEKVTLEKSREASGWLYVSTADGALKGWIRKDTISILKTPETPETKTAAPSNAATKKPAATKPKETAASKIGPPVVITIPAPQIPAKTNPTPAPTQAATTAPAANEPPPVEIDEVLRIETNEVSLNVRVLNAANRPVSGLPQDVFKVYEDDVLQPITSITTAEVPVINALVIDNSRSLRAQLAKVIEAGKIIVAANRPNDESAVVRFISSDKIEVIQDFTPAKNMLDNALDNLFVEGGQTAIIDAVYLTAKKIEEYKKSNVKDDVKTRSLILVSDGDDRSSKYTEQQLIQLLRDSNVQIYAVGFTGSLSQTPDANGVSRLDKAKSFLTRLAEETGGKVFFPESIEELPAIAKEISGELRTQYLISYEPTNESADRSFRKIKVEVADGPNQEKRTAITRSGRSVQPK